jgi:pyridoxine kinase
MQSLGCEVAALNTVQYSECPNALTLLPLTTSRLTNLGNHVGYGRFKGTRTTASEIEDLFEGLKLNGVDDFDMMLSGYIPGAEAVEAVGVVGRQLKLKANMKPGSFFWILDPVMGDNGKLYVAEEVVPMYKTLIRSADLILPNQYEAE